MQDLNRLIQPFLKDYKIPPLLLTSTLAQFTI
jgi:hypothetical protein